MKQPFKEQNASIKETDSNDLVWVVYWLVGYFGHYSPLRQYFSLHRAVFQREGERKEKWQTRVKMSKNTSPAPSASVVGPCPIIIEISRMPRHWKFTQNHLHHPTIPELYIGPNSVMQISRLSHFLFMQPRQLHLLMNFFSWFKLLEELKHTTLLFSPLLFY